MTITPTSCNTAWGFWGTIAHHADPSEAWALATSAIREATGCPDFAVRDFLDSRHGRHFADDVANELFEGHELKTAIERAIERWMTWTIDRRLSRETGIPHGLPYLVGLVTDCEVLADAAA